VADQLMCAEFKTFG